MANESDFAYIAANPPGGAPIPDLGNLQQGLQQGMGGPPQLAGQAETERAMENARQFQATMQAHNAAAARPPQPTKQTIKTDPNGNTTVAIEGPAELAEYYGKAGQFYQQALGGFAQQLSQVEQQTKQREDQMRSQPWVQLATALSANLAQAKDLPGWVQAMGRTAAQLNPTADELRNQRLGMLQQEINLAEKGVTLGEAAMRTRVGYEQHLATQTEKTTQDYTRRFEIAATKTGEAPVEDSFVKGFMQRVKGSTEDQARTEYARISDMASQRTETLSAAKVAADEKAQQAFQTRWDDRSMKRFFDPEQFAKEYKTVYKNATPEQVADAVRTQAGMAKQADALAHEIGSEKLAEFTTKANIKQTQALALVDQKYKDARENALALAKSKGLTGPAAERQADILSARDLVANLAKDLDRRPDLFGPAWLSPGNAIKRNLGLLYDEDVSLITADYQHAVPIMVKALHEGTRGYAANQRAWMESKVPQMSDTAERLKGKIAFMTGLLDAAQKGEDAGKAYVAAQMAAESPKGPPPNRASIQGATTSAPPAGAKDSGGPHNKVTKFKFNETTKQIEAQ